MHVKLENWEEGKWKQREDLKETLKFSLKGEKKSIASQIYRNNQDGFKFISRKVPHTPSMFNLRNNQNLKNVKGKIIVDECCTCVSIDTVNHLLLHCIVTRELW